MIDIDLRRYGQDKDYEKAVNAFFKGEELSLDCEFEEDSLEKLREMCSIPDDIKKKLVDIYNYMAINKNSRMELQFDTGIKFICEIDDSEWKSLPKVNLDDVLKGDINES